MILAVVSSFRHRRPATALFTACTGFPPAVMAASTASKTELPEIIPDNPAIIIAASADLLWLTAVALISPFTTATAMYAAKTSYIDALGICNSRSYLEIDSWQLEIAGRGFIMLSDYHGCAPTHWSMRCRSGPKS